MYQEHIYLDEYVKPPHPTALFERIVALSVRYDADPIPNDNLISKLQDALDSYAICNEYHYKLNVIEQVLDSAEQDVEDDNPWRFEDELEDAVRDFSASAKEWEIEMMTRGIHMPKWYEVPELENFSGLERFA